MVKLVDIHPYLAVGHLHSVGTKKVVEWDQTVG